MNFASHIAKRHSLQPAGHGLFALAPSLRVERDGAIHSG